MDDTSVVEKEEQKKTDISSYLATPRKKRKNFVVLAMGRDLGVGIGEKIDLYVKKAYPNLALSHPRDLAELARQFSRNISLLIIDDRFDAIEKIITSVASLKTKSKRDVSPVLFLTQDPNRLIQAYKTKLSMFQESDDYCDLGKMDASQIIGRVKIGIDQKNRRKSRRYNVNAPINFFHLTTDKSYPAKIIDMSIHGALISTKDFDRFAVNDQIKLNIPAKGILAPSQGEFLRITGKVRRVFIGGSIAGVSFEYLTSSQEHHLTKILTGVARDDLVK
jgi:hypothetical protein